MFSNILIATDGSENAIRAARQVAQTMKGSDVKVTVLSVADIPSMYLSDLSPESVDALVDDARQALKATERVLKREGLRCQTKLVEGGRAAEQIVQQAQSEGHDLIVMGSRGLSKGPKYGLGSVSREVADTAPTSVLLFRG